MTMSSEHGTPSERGVPAGSIPADRRSSDARRRESAPGFADMGLHPALLAAVSAAGYDHPTAIQQLAIPPALKGRDVLGCAQTGTGKTAAFSLPVLQHLDKTADDEPRLRALVLTPTRELAAQIGESFATYGRNLELWHTVIFGGVSDKQQIRELRRGIDALIATPGRLLDLVSRREIDLGHVELFVLDEADRMLDMGFLPDVRRIIERLPKERHTLFFSATMPPEIREFARGLLRDPVMVNAARVSAPAEGIDQRVYFVVKEDKRKLLVDILRAETGSKALVFSRTKHGANRIVRLLDQGGIEAAAIHGNKSQNARVRALESFREGSMRVLVATDLAARGLDVEGVTHVINFDLPNVPETYVHRIGRTARAGATGSALSLCDTEERVFLADIERLIGRHLARVDEHDYEAAIPPPPPTDLSSRASSAPAQHRASPGRGQRRNPTRRGPRPGRGARGRSN